MAEPGAKESLSRDQVRRVLSVSERQLRSWERQGLVPRAESYALADVIALRTLVELRAHGVAPVRIRTAIDALRRMLGGAENPLTQLKVFLDGRRIGVQFAGRKMEPITGQLLLDFDAAEIRQLLSFPSARSAGERRDAAQRRAEAERWFQRGLDLEAASAPPEEVMEAYQHAVELDEHSTGALVNLGTLHFNALDWSKAEECYRKALEADPNYALAHFNLGNLFDEQGQRAKALAHYQAALHIHADYSDAHYNLALLYQTGGEVMKAVRHWKAYLKLDPASSWAVIARRELDKLREALIGGRGMR